jgi:hypothetical protein
MAPGGPSPPSPARMRPPVNSIAQASGARRVGVTEYAADVCGGDPRGFDGSAAAVSADAHNGAESSRDVSDPTSGPRTLTPGSVRGSLTPRLRV